MTLFCPSCLFGLLVVVVAVLLLLVPLALVLVWLRWARVGVSAGGVHFLLVHALGVFRCARGVVFGWACFAASAWECALALCAGVWVWVRMSWAVSGLPLRARAYSKFYFLWNLGCRGQPP